MSELSRDGFLWAGVHVRSSSLPPSKSCAGVCQAGETTAGMKQMAPFGSPIIRTAGWQSRHSESFLTSFPSFASPRFLRVNLIWFGRSAEAWVQQPGLRLLHRCSDLSLPNWLILHCVHHSWFTHNPRLSQLKCKVTFCVELGILGFIKCLHYRAVGC